MAGRDLCGHKLGEFVLREQIGQGGYGAVYRCEQRDLKRQAVVKVLWRTDIDGAHDRFLREAQLASRLDHPYAAHVYASGVAADDQGRLFWIAMELVQGVTLAEWLKRHGPMPLDQLVPFFECVAEVVHAAHEREIVHRDLKPSNIMVLERGGRLLPKLLDFGIAKTSREIVQQNADDPLATAQQMLDASNLEVWARAQPTRSDLVVEPKDLTHSNARIGSRPYMSPEQWSDASRVGPATDIYSLGIVAYEALTGRVPFTGASTGEYYRHHMHADVPELGDGFPADLDGAIRRALAKDPAQRQGSALELASELRAALQAQPREQLRFSAQQWNCRARSPGFLWRGEALTDLERWREGAPSETLSELECSFVAESQRRARRARWFRRSLLMVAAAVVFGLLQYRAMMRTELAERIATESEVEQGRQALLHGETSNAARHLAQAYERGDRSPGVAFMLARALEPRMAELERLTSSSGRMWSAMFAPDGKRILTTDDASARMWDAASGQLLFTMTHGDIVYAAVFSPDGSRIITAGGDGTVRIWSAATGAPLRQLTDQRSDTKWRYYAVAMSSEVVAAVDVMGRVAHVWDAVTGKQITELANDASELGALAFSADGQWLATSGGDEVRVFDTSTWEHVVTIAGPRVRSFRFDPTGPRVAIGTYDGVASLWDVPSGTRLRSLREAGESVDAIAFSRDGAVVATGSREGAEQVWDARSGGLRSQFNSHHSKIYSLEFSPSGDLLLSAGADGAAFVSNVATGMPVAKLEGPTGLVFAAHFDADARRVVGASWDGTARVWNATARNRRWALPPVGRECDTMDSLVPDGQFIALSCRGRGTHVWDTARGELVAELPSVTAVAGDYYSAFPALTATGDRAAIARGRTVEVYALPSGQLLRKVTHSASVNAVAFAPAGHDLVSGAIDGSLLLTRDDREPTALLASPDGIDVATILADGRVVAADASARLRVIEPHRNALLMDVPLPYRVRLLRPATNGTRLLTISTRGKQTPPSLWDLDEHRLVAHLEGHVGRVFTARFVAEERMILTAGADGSARMWDAMTGKPGRSFIGDSYFLADATLSPDGSTVLAGGSDGFLRFWDTSTGRLLWTLQAHKTYVIGIHYEDGDIVTRAFAGDVARWTLPRADSVIEACRAAACSPTASVGR